VNIPVTPQRIPAFFLGIDQNEEEDFVASPNSSPLLISRWNNRFGLIPNYAIFETEINGGRGKLKLAKLESET
jgi:hypothetical protein